METDETAPSVAEAPTNPPPAEAGGATKPGTDGAISSKVFKELAACKKIVVAIHGIGDQYRNATIQSVVNRFGSHCNYPAAIPLGSFQAESGIIKVFRLQEPPGIPTELQDIGFVEVYWADIPRTIQKEGFTIEETKAWVRTIVQRVRARSLSYETEALKLERQDYRTTANVLEEMIETLHTIGNLLTVGEKMGLAKFDLDHLLTNFLGDVQVVADFAGYRQKILAEFRKIMDAVWLATTKLDRQGVSPFPVSEDRKTPDYPEIYIVAHSEGTVVAFMGLLQAMSAPDNTPKPPPRAAWIENVRGFMTIGSPIDKHILLFPDMWKAFRKAEIGGVKIKWRNYYDHGDPVGFKLDTTRIWMKDQKHYWTDAFQFDDGHDMGFTRYLLPGAAHNEYWTDPAVFGHFIQTVMEIPPNPKLGRDFAERPKNRGFSAVGSLLIPYALAFGLLFFGTYLLNQRMRDYLGGEALGVPTSESIHTVSRAINKTTLEAGNGSQFVMIGTNSVVLPTENGPARAPTLTPTPTPSPKPDPAIPVVKPDNPFAKNVWGMTFLLLAITLGARIPRLTRAVGWRFGAAAFFIVFASLYVWLVTPEERAWLGFHAVVPGFQESDAWWPTVKTLVLAVFIVALATLAWRLPRVPDWLSPLLRGLRPLLLPAAGVIAWIIIFHLLHASTTGKPLWPLLLGAAAFLYLWWLAALLFDLVFVWHRYIRHATLQDNLQQVRKIRVENEKPAAEEKKEARRDEYHALTVICRALENYLPDLLDEGRPTYNAQEKNIQRIFWILKRQDENAGGTETRVQEFIAALKSEIPWTFVLTEFQLTNGDFKTINDLLGQIMNS